MTENPEDKLLKQMQKKINEVAIAMDVKEAPHDSAAKKRVIITEIFKNPGKGHEGKDSVPKI